MCNHCCNSCSNVTNYAIPVYGKLRVNGNCVSLQLQSCQGGSGCSGTTNGVGTGTATGQCGCGCQSGYTACGGCASLYGGQRNGGCGCQQSYNQGCNYGYFGCCRRRNATTVVGTTSADGETDFYVNRCGSYSGCGAAVSRSGCCCNG